MKQTTPDPAVLVGPTPSTPVAPGVTPTYTSPAASVLPLPTSKTSTTSTAPAPTGGNATLKTEVH